MHRILTLKIF